MLPRLMLFESSERSLVTDAISPESVDGFKKIKQCLEAKKILHNLY